MPTLYPADWPYFVLLPPEERGLDICDVKNWLRIDADDVSDDTTIKLLMDGVVDDAENLSYKTMVKTQFRTFRNGFSDTRNFIAGGETPIELRKSPFMEAETITLAYLVSGTFTPLVEDTDYFVETSDDYVKLRPTTDNEWPTDIDEIEQSIRIDFYTGFGDAPADVPKDLQLAMLQHIASEYENRGEANGSDIPVKAAKAYRRRRILTV